MIPSQDFEEAQWSEANISELEVVIASATILGSQNYYALWYDESQLTHYEARVSGNVDISEEQFIEIIEGLV